MTQDASLEHLVLSDGQVIVRSAHAGDQPLLMHWLSDPEVYRHWGGKPATAEDAAAHCRVQVEEDVCWPFIISSDGDAAGFIQAWGVDRRGGLDLFVAPPYRRRGIGTRAVTMLATHLRDAHGWTRITVDPGIDDARAVAFFQRAGFIDTGERLEEDDRTLAVMEFR